MFKANNVTIKKHEVLFANNKKVPLKEIIHTPSLFYKTSRVLLLTNKNNAVIAHLCNKKNELNNATLITKNQADHSQTKCIFYLTTRKTHSFDHGFTQSPY